MGDVSTPGLTLGDVNVIPKSKELCGSQTELCAPLRYRVPQSGAYSNACLSRSGGRDCVMKGTGSKA